LERLAHADRDRFFSDVEVRQARHQRTGIEVVDAFFKEANRHPPLVEAEQFFFSYIYCGIVRHLRGGGHAGTPESLASKWKRPLESSRSAMRPPIAPRPMYPRFAIGGTAFKYIFCEIPNPKSQRRNP